MAAEMIVLKTFEYNMFPQVKKIKYPVSGIGKNCDPGIFYVIFFVCTIRNIQITASTLNASDRRVIYV